MTMIEEGGRACETRRVFIMSSLCQTIRKISTLYDKPSVFWLHTGKHKGHMRCVIPEGHALPSTNFDQIVLAMEDAEEHCEQKAKLLVTEFKHAFLDIDYTIHPSEMAGEARGKSSNLAWAARSVCRSRLQSKASLDQAIITIMDGELVPDT
jgi:hypothetical protein